MNYRDFFKNKRVTRKDILNLLPEGVDQKEFDKGIGTEKEHTDDEFTAAKIAGDHLKEDPKYYTKLSDAGLEEEEVGEHCGACEDDMDVDDNGGLPKVGGALAVPHHGQPIMMGKIIQVGAGFGKSATGELSGMSSVKPGGVAKDTGGVKATEPNDKEPITAGGKGVDSSIASKSVGGNVVPGEGQKQGGPNSKGTIAGTSQLSENKDKVRKIVKEVLKEIRFDKATGKWVKLNEAGHKAGCGCGFCKNKSKFSKKGDKEDKEDVDETVNIKMGKSYKTVQPRQYKVCDDDVARTNQYDPQITEMYDDEEETTMNERYVELANASRNLSEAELSELKTLREKIDNVNISKRNWGASQGGVEPNLYETEAGMKMGPSYKVVQPTLAKTSADNFARTNQYDPQMSENEETSKTCGGCGENMDIKYFKGKDGQVKDECDTCRGESNSGFEPQHDNPGYKPCDCEDYPACGHGGEMDEEQQVCEPGSNLGHKGQSGYRLWVCSKCGHEVSIPSTERKPDPKRWADGHVCNFVEEDDGEGVGAEPVGIGEAGIGAVQHSSYRTVKHGNLKQDPKQRWADDLDEGSKKPSKVAKTIAKGQEPKKTKKNPFLKFQKAKKTTSGVHKRKT